MTPNDIALNRFGMGARPHDTVGGDPRGWVSAQLHRFDARPARLAGVAPTPQIIGEMADAYAMRKEMRAEAKETAALATPPAVMAAAPTSDANLPPALKGAGPQAVNLFKAVRGAYIASVGARTAVAATSDTPFVERLVGFWSNHFAVSIDKLPVVGLAGPFEFEAIRPFVLGHFGDLLLSVESHPAMLLYLDQAQSIGPNSVSGQRAAAFTQTKRGLNENLAREIMELHTLGVRTVYTQADVTEFARALTGWTVAGLRQNRFMAGLKPGAAFVEGMHEPGTRTIMGKRYGEDGYSQGRAVLADLAAHPATARHIATKLARHFTTDDPPPTLVARLETAFLTSRGHLPTVYAALIASPEPWTAPPAKFRSPWEWGVASLRAVGSAGLPDRIAVGTFNQLGQPLWKPGSPAGYDDISASWAAPDALLRRVEAAGRIAETTPVTDARALGATLFPGSLSAATGQAVAQADSPSQALALLLASPEMMRR